MKPRTANERECVAISDKLPPLTEKQKQYGFKHCFSKQAKITNKKGNTVCLECGEQFHVDNITANTVICPHCHSKLKTDGVLRKRKQESTFQVITTRKGWQIIRTFEVWKWTHGKEACQYRIEECVQRFMKPSCKDVVIARPMFMGFGFDYRKNMTVKYECKNNSYSPYNIWACVTYPFQSILPIVKRNGYCKWLKENASFSTTFHRLVENTNYETIAKCQRFDIWEHLTDYFVNTNWYLVKMLIRHNYVPTDFSIWQDLIRFVNDLELDSHSPKYVLPNDLKAMHDMLFKRIERKRKEEEKERKRKEMAKNKAYDREFKKTNANLLKMVIVVGDITIKPLQNYREYVSEGKEMHHCVETYWMHKDSFILSARQNGERIATIELDRTDFHVKQCRGHCNEIPEQYDQLVAIMKKNQKKFIKQYNKK